MNTKLKKDELLRAMLSIASTRDDRYPLTCVLLEKDKDGHVLVATDGSVLGMVRLTNDVLTTDKPQTIYRPLYQGRKLIDWRPLDDIDSVRYPNWKVTVFKPEKVVSNAASVGAMIERCKEAKEDLYEYALGREHQRKSYIKAHEKFLVRFGDAVFDRDRVLSVLNCAKRLGIQALSVRADTGMRGQWPRMRMEHTVLDTFFLVMGYRATDEQKAKSALVLA